MTLKFYFILCAALCGVVAAGGEWKFRPEGSKQFHDDSGDGWNATLLTKQPPVSGHDDGIHLRPYDTLRVEPLEEMNFPDGFVAEVTFSCDLKPIDVRENFSALLTKGDDFDRSYCIMVRRDGALLINLKGMTPEYHIIDAKLQSHRKYHLLVAVGPQKVQVYLDGSPIATYPVTGKLAATTEPLYFGAIHQAHYPLTGQLFAASLQSYDHVELPAAGATVLHWKFQDGSGSSTVKDLGPGHLDGRIAEPDKAQWSREDDRGWFLCLRGGGVILPSHETLSLRNDLAISCRFSVDPSGIAPGARAALLTYGTEFGVWITPDGTIEVTGNTANKETRQLPVHLSRNKDYLLELRWTGNSVRVSIDGTLAAQQPFALPAPDPTAAWRLGGIVTEPFPGNIYELKFIDTGSARPETAAGTEPEMPLESLIDPPGTVLVRDFSQFQPAPILGGMNSHPVNWQFRTDAEFMHQTTCVLHPPLDITGKEPSFDPHLTGQYDIYAGVRAVGEPLLLQFRLNEDDPEYYTIQTETSPDKHRNLEVLVDRDVTMDGRSIHLASCGYFYLGYLKFIPVAERREKDVPPSPWGSVRRAPRMDRAAMETWAARRIDEKIRQGYFIERHYVDSKPEPPPSARSLQRGYRLFPWNWMDLLFPASIPETEADQLQLAVELAPGEYEPVTFGIRGLRDLGPTTLVLPEKFTAEDGSSTDIEVKIAVPESLIKRTTDFSDASEFIDAPQYLNEIDTQEIQGGKSSQFWLTVHAGTTAAPGTYRGNLTLRHSDFVETIPLTITVWPIRLDPVSGYDIGFWTYFTNPDEARQIIREQASHGMTSCVTYGLQSLLLTGNSPETIRIDFEHSLLPVIAEEFRDQGMTGNLHLTSKVFMDKLTGMPEKQRRETYCRLVKELQDYAASHNWPPLSFVSYDEVLSEPGSLPDFSWEVHLQHELGLTTAEDHIWYKTSRPYQKEVDAIADAIRIFIVRYNTRNLWYVDSCPEMAATAAAKQVKLYAYNSNNAVYHTQFHTMRFMTGWFFRSLGRGFSGQMTWAYNYTRENPYNDLDANCADSCFRYPSDADRRGGYALNLEACREGIDDLRYIQTLEHRIREAEAYGWDISEYRRLLDTLSGSFDEKRFREKSVFMEAQWDRCWEDADGIRYMSGRYQLPNGWNSDAYREARKNIAAAIVELTKRLDAAAPDATKR